MLASRIERRAHTRFEMERLSGANESKIKQTYLYEYLYECRREKKKIVGTEAEEVGDDEIGGGDGDSE